MLLVAKLSRTDIRKLFHQMMYLYNVFIFLAIIILILSIFCLHACIYSKILSIFVLVFDYTYVVRLIGRSLAGGLGVLPVPPAGGEGVFCEALLFGRSLFLRSNIVLMVCKT